MLTRQEVLDTILKECTICKHLFTKIPGDAFDFKPTENQRTTIALLRYLSVCGIASLQVMLHESDWGKWKPYGDAAKEMKPEDFPAAMDKQMGEIEDTFNAIPDSDFQTVIVKHPTGGEMTLGAGILNMTLSWLTAYRMQLFLYAKQSGAHDIGTSNNWSGIDRPAKV
jgi:hypothetical protein